MDILRNGRVNDKNGEAAYFAPEAYRRYVFRENKGYIIETDAPSDYFEPRNKGAGPAATYQKAKEPIPFEFVTRIIGLETIGGVSKKTSVAYKVLYDRQLGNAASSAISLDDLSNEIERALDNVGVRYDNSPDKFNLGGEGIISREGREVNSRILKLAKDGNERLARILIKAREKNVLLVIANPRALEHLDVIEDAVNDLSEGLFNKARNPFLFVVERSDDLAHENAFGLAYSKTSDPAQLALTRVQNNGRWDFPVTVAGTKVHELVHKLTWSRGKDGRPLLKPQHFLELAKLLGCETLVKFLGGASEEGFAKLETDFAQDYLDLLKSTGSIKEFFVKKGNWETAAKEIDRIIEAIAYAVAKQYNAEFINNRYGIDAKLLLEVERILEKDFLVVESDGRLEVHGFDGRRWRGPSYLLAPNNQSRFNSLELQELLKKDLSRGFFRNLLSGWRREGIQVDPELLKPIATSSPLAQGEDQRTGAVAAGFTGGAVKAAGGELAGGNGGIGEGIGGKIKFPELPKPSSPINDNPYADQGSLPMPMALPPLSGVIMPVVVGSLVGGLGIQQGIASSSPAVALLANLQPVFNHDILQMNGIDVGSVTAHGPPAVNTTSLLSRLSRVTNTRGKLGLLIVEDIVGLANAQSVVSESEIIGQDAVGASSNIGKELGNAAIVSREFAPEAAKTSGSSFATSNPLKLDNISLHNLTLLKSRLVYDLRKDIPYSEDEKKKIESSARRKGGDLAQAIKEAEDKLHADKQDLDWYRGEGEIFGDMISAIDKLNSNPQVTGVNAEELLRRIDEP
ncbi:MAG: hypothetical protein ACYDEQ_10295, partial [Desulfocucumaceae bacterium]